MTNSIDRSLAPSSPIENQQKHNAVTEQAHDPHRNGLRSGGQRVDCRRMKDLLQIPTENLQKAIAIKREIDRLQAKLSALLGGAAAEPAVKPKRRLSAAARKRISEAAKARWARYRAQKAAKGAKS